MSSPSRACRDRPSGPSLERGRFAFGIAAAAALGGAVALALALLVGALHTRRPVTTVLRAPATAATSEAAGAWASVYRKASAGAVDITVKAWARDPTPHGASAQTHTVLGSGFVIDAHGDIVTAAHVLMRAASIRVAFPDGAIRSATVRGRVESADLALIHVRPASLKLRPLPLGSSATLRVGEPLAVIGDPLGFRRSLSTGVVSEIDRTIRAPDGSRITHAIQTDAAINPGNSGGPLLDVRGRVVGIADQIATGTKKLGDTSGSTTSTGVGFAVPVDLLRRKLPELEHGQAGSVMQLLTETLHGR